MNVKQKFPNEEALKAFIQENLENITSAIKTDMGHLEAGYIKAKKDQSLGWFLLIVGASPFVLGDLAQEFIDFSPTVVWLSLFIGLTLCIFGWRKQRNTHKIIKNFNKELNQSIFIKVFDIFGLHVKLLSAVGELEHDKTKDLLKLFKQALTAGKKDFRFDSLDTIIKKELDNSELITEDRNRFVAEDALEVDLGERKLFISELDIQNVTGSGKNRRVKKIFQGYFFTVDLLRPLTGKTFVTTEGDTSGFGNQSMFGKSDVSKTELEWNDFENKLHVSTSDPVEARYILTTDFMSDLYDWWKDRHQKIRVSFIGKKMYFIYPDQNIRINSTIKKISNEEIGDYMESICIPLLHSLYLVEDVTK